jgi:outer membrane cobalamin receptor
LLYNRNATVLGNSVKEVTDTGQIAYYRPNNLVGAECFIELMPNKHFDIVAGIFGHYETLSDGYSNTYSNAYFTKPEKPAKPEKESNVLSGIFLQMDYRFFNYWQFTPGLRYEYNTIYNHVLTPRVSLLFNKNKFSSKLIYARAYRAPKPWDFTDGLGNPDLEPEYFNSLEFSGTYFITDNFKTEVSLYNNNLNNGIIKEYNADNSNYRWSNFGNTQTTGIELISKLAAVRTSVFIIYSYNHSTDNFDKIVKEIAPHSGVMGFNYKFHTHFNIGIRMFYFGRRKNAKIIQATNSEYVDAAFVVNLNLSVLNYKNSNIQFIIKNLTNTEYYHTSNLLPDRYRQPQISFLLKLSYKIEKL